MGLSERGSQKLDSPHEGMVEGFSLDNYLLLLDYTGRHLREGKAVISAEVGAIFDRLGSSAENWEARLQKLADGCLTGAFFAVTRPPIAGRGPSPGRALLGHPGRVRGTLRLGGTPMPF